MNTFWTDAELNAWINEALRVWNVCTGYNKNNYPSQTFSPFTFLYGINSCGTNAMFVLRIEANNDHNTIAPVTIKELDNMDINWVGKGAFAPTNWMQIGANKFYLYPSPFVTYRPINIYTVDKFPVPVVDGDFVQVGEEDLQYIVDYCVFVARLKEGGKEAMEAVSLLKGFLEQASKYNSKILQTSIYKRVMGIAFQQQQRPARYEKPSAR